MKREEKEMAVMALLAGGGMGVELNDGKKRRLLVHSTVLFLGYIADTGILSLKYALCTRMYATEELIKYNLQ
jgi:hypothetical protein